MSSEEQEMAEKRRLFGTNGIRGVVGTEITVEFALEMGLAIGTYFEGEIVIGTDSRTSNHMLKNAVIAGLLSSGCDVRDIGMAPTPSVQYSVAKSDASAGVMITASHNPPQFNGIKVIDTDGTEPHFSKELDIENIYFTKSHIMRDWQSVGTLRYDDEGNARYLDGILDNVEASQIGDKKLRAVIDCANGVGALVTPGLFSELGIEVISMYQELDGRNPAHPSEPTPENLEALMNKVVDEGASFGVAHDGDADRTIFIDENGKYIWGDRSFAALAGYIVSKYPGSYVVSTIATSDCVSDMVLRNGGKVVQTRVGSPVVARKMIELDAVFGGEENGGLILARHQYCRDGAMTAALMAEMISVKGSLSELMKDVPVYHQVKLKTECPNERKKEVLESLLASVGDRKIDSTDGLKIYEEGDWVLVRPSGTEPIIRIFSQSKSDEKASSLATDYMHKLKKIIG